MGAGPDSITLEFEEKPCLPKTPLELFELAKMEYGRRRLVSLRERVASEQQLRRDILQAIQPLHVNLDDFELYRSDEDA